MYFPKASSISRSLFRTYIYYMHDMFIIMLSISTRTSFLVSVTVCVMNMQNSCSIRDFHFSFEISFFLFFFLFYTYKIELWCKLRKRYMRLDVCVFLISIEDNLNVVLDMSHTYCSQQLLSECILKGIISFWKSNYSKELKAANAHTNDQLIPICWRILFIYPKPVVCVQYLSTQLHSYCNIIWL